MLRKFEEISSILRKRGKIRLTGIEVGGSIQVEVGRLKKAIIFKLVIIIFSTSYSHLKPACRVSLFTFVSSAQPNGLCRAVMESKLTKLAKCNLALSLAAVLKRKNERSGFAQVFIASGVGRIYPQARLH